MSDAAGNREVALYLAGVTGIAAANVTVLCALFVTGFPQFLAQFTQDPGSAVSEDPVSPVLALVSLVLVTLLFVLVVVFGAKHGPDPERRRSQD
jgi:uncharacterized membrane protein YqhA